MADSLHVDGFALVGERGVARDDKRPSHPREVGGQALGDTVDKVLLLGIAAEVGERQNDDREVGGGIFRCRGRSGFGGLADAKRIETDRLGDVLELSLAEIADREIKPPFDLPIRLFGEADRARLANAFEPRGDIDPVAHQIAVALFDDVAEMYADTKFDAALGRLAGIALDHALLHVDRAAHRVDDAAELDEAAVAGALDDAPMMRGDCGINQVAAQRAQPRQRSFLVRSGEPTVTDNIGDQDRCNFPGLAHGAPSRLPP